MGGKQLSVSDEETRVELQERLQKDLKEILCDVQQYSRTNSLAHTDPGKWLFIAQELCKGVPPTRIHLEHGGDYYAVRRIQAQLSESPIAVDLKRELSTHVVENLHYNAEIQPKLNDIILKKLEDGEGEDVSLTELMKAKRELGVDNKLANETLSRLRGDNVQRIEVTQKTESFEDMMKALREAQAQMPKPAEVVDVEATEGS